MTTKRRANLIHYSTAAMVAIVPVAAFAQTQTFAFNIKAQSLDGALRQFARVTRQQILFDGRLIKGRRADALIGTLSAEEGLERLLAGSGLRAQRGERGALVIKSASPAAEQTPKPPLAEAGNDSDDRGISEILVTAARTLNADIRRSEDDAQPYVVLDAKKIAQSGAQSLEAFLNKALSSNAANSNNAQLAGGNTKSTISLRGLGMDETLILIDGRRTPGYAVAGIPGQPDINSIPIESVERIEILPTTSSGIYGGSATGGVVNIILKRDYRGVTIAARYGNSFRQDFNNRRIDINGGTSFNGGDTSVNFSLSYSGAGDLLVGDRDVVRRGRRAILHNDPAFLLGAATPPLGATTNIRSTNGTNLTLKTGGALGSAITFVPAGYTGIASDQGAALIANAGKYNLDLAQSAELAGGGGGTLVSSPSLLSGRVNIRQTITPWLSAFVEGTASRNKGTAIQNGGPVTVALTAADAANPFNQAITVTTPMLGVDTKLENDYRTYRLLGGLIAKLPAGWSSEVDYSWSRTRQASTGTSTPRPTEVRAAIAAGSPDIFRADAQDNVSFLAYAYPQGYAEPAHGTFNDVSLRAGGPLGLGLPGGPIKITGLLEHREQRYSGYTSYQPNIAGGLFAPKRSQRVDSAYLEAVFPIISPANDIPLVEALELQLSGRAERYRTRGANVVTIRNGVPQNTAIYATNRFSSKNPTIALRYQPIRSFALRGSYGTGFLPPSVDQLTINSSQVVPAATASALGLRDPVRNEVLGAFTISRGGNSNTLPERTKSYSLGGILTPVFLPGFRASLDWSQIKKRDALYAPPPANPVAIATVILNYPERVTRDPPAAGQTVGRVTALDLSAVNLASLKLETWDVSLAYDFDTERLGSFSLGSKATYIAHSKSQYLASTAPVEDAGTYAAIKWKGNASLSWQKADWTVGLNTTYYSSYYIQNTHAVFARQGGAKVKAQSYTDLFVSKRFAGGPLGGIEVQFGVNNVFDKTPPIDLVNGALFYYSTFGDPTGANYYLSVKKSF